MQRIIVIPARLQSERLPNKPLLKVGGKPLIQWTYELAERAHPDELVVASPDNEILDTVEGFGGRAMLTHLKHPSGTHRTAQVAWDLWDGSSISQVMSLQADEPLLEPRDLVRMFDISNEMNYGITTLVAALPEKEKLLDENLVKAAYGGSTCYWFSRAPMSGAYGHIGVYLFRTSVLINLASLNPSKLARAESLEQLTWIEAGHAVHALEADWLPISINTQQDLDEFKRLVECPSES